MQKNNRQRVLFLGEEADEMHVVLGAVLVTDRNRKVRERVDLLLMEAPGRASGKCQGGRSETYQSNVFSQYSLAFVSHSWVMPYLRSCCTPSYVTGPIFDNFNSILNSSSWLSETERVNFEGLTSAFLGMNVTGSV